ncbi:MAG: FtsX-like permease family protein [Desulfobacula sp.]|jgi:putative ABC transport system permease protein
MNIKFKKAVQDLRINPSRTILALLSLVIGVWGIGSVLVSYTILSNDLNANFLQTRPAHLVLESKEFQKINLSQVIALPDIENAEFRDLSKLRVETAPDKWKELWIFGIENFDTFNLAKIFHEKGDRTPKQGSILIERDGMRISRLDTGVQAKIQGPTLGTLHVPVDGICFDPVLSPSSQDHIIYAYADKKTYSAITGNATGQRMILRFHQVKTRDDVRKTAQKLIRTLEQKGIAIDKVIIPKLNEHPHQWQLNTLLLLQGSIGFLAFLMGAVLIWQLINEILARQVRQIGILKAVGASQNQILLIYLTIIILLGLAASLIAVPAAVATGYAFAGFVSRQLNFNILTTRLPVYVYAGLFAAGVLMPLFSSLFPILARVRTSVQDALNDSGVSQGGLKTTPGLFARLPVSYITQLAFRNSVRRKNRVLITILTMSLGVAVFNTGFNVRQSIKSILQASSRSMNYDILISLTAPQQPSLIQPILAPIKGINRIEAWSGGRGVIQTGMAETTDEAGIIALPHDTDFLKPDVIEGRWLKESDRNEIVVNQKMLETFHHPVIGKDYVLNAGGQLIPVRLVGVINEFALEKIYMDKAGFDALLNPSKLVTNLVVSGMESGYQKTAELERTIEAAIESSGLAVRNVESQSERMKLLYDHLNIILVMLLSMAVMVLVVASFGMASAMGINIMERTREIGIMRAIGATPAIIRRIFVIEGIVVSMSGVLLGLLAAWPLSIKASRFFGSLIIDYPLPFSMSHTGLLITIAATLASGWLASKIASREAMKLSCRQALAYE